MTNNSVDSLGKNIYICISVDIINVENVIVN